MLIDDAGNDPPGGGRRLLLQVRLAPNRAGACAKADRSHRDDGVFSGSVSHDHANPIKIVPEGKVDIAFQVSEIIVQRNKDAGFHERGAERGNGRPEVRSAS